MLNEHDQALLLRCRRLGHEVTFGYCRQETGGKPCRLILDCWWEQFNVRAFLQAHLSAEEMSAVERVGFSAPTSKVQNLFDLIQQTKDRLKEKPCRYRLRRRLLWVALVNRSILPRSLRHHLIQP